MKTLILALIVTVITLPAFAAEKESAYDRVIRTNTLRCGYYPWPPYSIVDPNTGKVSGLIPDIANAVGKLLDLKVEFVQMSAVGMQAEELKKGLYDSFCVDSYYVFSSIKYTDYSDPYLYAPIYAYKKAEDKRFKSFSDLNNPNVTFVGLDGDVSVTLVYHKFPEAKLKTVPANADPSTMMMEITTGKADVALLDPGLVSGFNKTNPVHLTMIEPGHAIAVYPISFSVRKGENELLNVLNGAVSALNNMNAITPLVKKYDLGPTEIYPVAKPYEVKQ